MPRSIMPCKPGKPKAIFFDVGGVLLSYSAWIKADLDLDQELRNKFPRLNIRQLHRAWEHKWAKQHLLANGFVTMRRQAENSLHVALMQQNCRSTRAYEKRVLRAWYDVAEKNAEAMPDASYVLKELSSGGYRIGIITNADWDVVVPHLRRTNLLKYIDYKIVSSKIKSYKPNLMAFSEALRISGLKPEEVAFVGDSVKNDIEPAMKVGMRALLFGSGKRNDRAISGLKCLLEIFC